MESGSHSFSFQKDIKIKGSLTKKTKLKRQRKYFTIVAPQSSAIFAFFADCSLDGLSITKTGLDFSNPLTHPHTH